MFQRLTDFTRSLTDKGCIAARLDQIDGHMVKAKALLQQIHCSFQQRIEVQQTGGNAGNFGSSFQLGGSPLDFLDQAKLLKLASDLVGDVLQDFKVFLAPILHLAWQDIQFADDLTSERDGCLDGPGFCFLRVD